MSAFAEQINENDYNLISFYDYSKLGPDFLTELDGELQRINETNELIDGNPTDEGYEDTSLMSNIYHGFTTKYGGTLYIDINKIPVQGTYVYTFQIFTETKTGLVCAQSTIRELDEKNVLKSALDMPHIKDIIKCLFKLKEQ